MDLRLILLNSEERGVPDESDHFKMDPVGSTEELANDRSLPSHVVLFESEERALREFLLLHSFLSKRWILISTQHRLNPSAFSFGLYFFLVTQAINDCR